MNQFQGASKRKNVRKKEKSMRASDRARIKRNHKKQIVTNNNCEQVDARLAVRIISVLHSGVLDRSEVIQRVTLMFNIY